MAFTITPADVQAFCPAAGALDTSKIQIYINMVNQADQCLDSKNIADEIQQFLKLNAVCHYLTREANNGGAVKSEKADALAISFDNYKQEGYGLSSSTFGQNILSSGDSDCFEFMNQRPSRFMVSFGRGKNANSSRY